MTAKPPSKPDPPVKLSKPAAEWIREMHDGWSYSPGEEQVLVVAAAAWDRWRQAKAQIDKDGLAIRDRFGQLRVHPVAVIERDARSAKRR